MFISVFGYASLASNAAVAAGRFTQMDSYGGNSEDPLSLHKYLYAEDNSITGSDPSGNIFLLDMLSSAADEAEETAEGSGVLGAVGAFTNTMRESINVYEGFQSEAFKGVGSQ